MDTLRSRPFWLTVALFITDGLFFSMTNPIKVASILLIVGFALLLVTAYWLLYKVQRLAGVYVPRLRARRRLSLAITAVLGLLLALQSVGQLTTRDSLLIIIAALVLYSYTTYGKQSPSE